MNRITGISSMATQALLADLAAAFQAETGIAVLMESVGGVDATRRVAAGESFDQQRHAIAFVADIQTP